MSARCTRATMCSAKAIRSTRSPRCAPARSRPTSSTATAASTCSASTCPGEVIGLNAIDGEHYPCNAVALDTVMLCRFSFPKMAVLATQLPGLQQHLFRLLSRDIGNAALLAGDWTADRAHGCVPGRPVAAPGRARILADRFQLTMARTDIANYLRLAPETVSRVLKRFQDDGLLQVDRRELELVGRDATRGTGRAGPAPLSPPFRVPRT